MVISTFLQMQMRMRSRNSSRSLVWSPYFFLCTLCTQYTANLLSQLFCTTQIVTQAARMRSRRDFKRFSLRTKSSLIPTSAQSMTPTVFEPATSIELAGILAATLGPTSVANTPPLPKLQPLVPVLHNLLHPQLELSDIRTLSPRDNLPAKQPKKEPRLGKAPMKPGSG